MAWYERYTNKVQPAEPAGGEAHSVEEVHTEQNWPMLAALAVFALAFATLVVLSGRWAYNHWHTKPAPARTQDLPAPPPTDLQPR